MVAPPRRIEPKQNFDDVAEANLGSRRRPLAFRGRKPDAVEDWKRHRQYNGIGGVTVTVAAPDQCASTHFFDSGDRRTEADLYLVLVALCCEKFQEGGVAPGDAALCMMSAN